MSGIVLILGCLLGAAVVFLLLHVGAKLAPLVLGGLVLAWGIYEGVQIGGDWGWIVGVGSGVGGAIFLLAQLADPRKKKEPKPPLATAEPVPKGDSKPEGDPKPEMKPLEPPHKPLAPPKPPSDRVEK